MRPIDADALIAEIESAFEGMNYELSLSGALFAVTVLKCAPTLTLDDLRPKGRWERKEDGKVYCGVCEKKALNIKRHIHFIPRFCYHCGADMRGGGEDG